MRTTPIVLLLALAACSKSDPPSPSPSGSPPSPPVVTAAATATAKAAPPAPKAVAVGEEAYAYYADFPDSADIPVYPAEKLFDQWEKAILTENSAELQRVFMQVHNVPPGGKVLVLAIGKPVKTFSLKGETMVLGEPLAPRVKVRIVTGEDQGKEGFVSMKDLHTTPLPPK